MSLDMGMLIAGAKLQGEFEDRLIQVRQDICKGSFVVANGPRERILKFSNKIFCLIPTACS